MASRASSCTCRYRASARSTASPKNSASLPAFIVASARLRWQRRIGRSGAQHQLRGRRPLHRRTAARRSDRLLQRLLEPDRRLRAVERLPRHGSRSPVRCWTIGFTGSRPISRRDPDPVGAVKLPVGLAYALTFAEFRNSFESDGRSSSRAPACAARAGSSLATKCRPSRAISCTPAPASRPGASDSRPR